MPRSAWCPQAPNSLLFLFPNLPNWKIRISLCDGVQLGVDREHPVDVFDRRHCYFLRLIPTRGHRISSCLSVCYTCTDRGGGPMHSQHHIVVSVSFWAEGLEQCLIHSRITEFG